MANAGGLYSFYQDSVDGVTRLRLGWTSGISGALPASFPSGFNNANSEIKSVTRTGTGAITIGLKDPWWASACEFTYHILQASYANTGACSVYLVEDHSTNPTTPELKILITNAAGTATDPTTGDQVNLTFGMVIKASN